MNMVQVYIKGQEDKELSSFFRYYPVRIKNMVATILRLQSA